MLVDGYAWNYNKLSEVLIIMEIWTHVEKILLNLHVRLI